MCGKCAVEVVDYYILIISCTVAQLKCIIIDIGNKLGHNIAAMGP